MNKTILILIVSFSLIVFAQNKFKLEADYSRFIYDDTTGYLEIYYSFYKEQLKPIQKDSDTVVSGLLNIKIINKDNNFIVVNKKWKFEESLNTNSPGNSQNSLVGVLGFRLRFGNYVCTLIGKDTNDSSKTDTIYYSFDISKYPPDKFSLSDIQLASSIQQVNDPISSDFYKNAYEVIPNPSLLYGESVPNIFLYAELYNIDKEIHSKILKLEYILLSSTNEQQYRKVKILPRHRNSAVEVAAINISKIPSGRYTLIITASDSAKNQIVSSSKRLFIYNPSIIDTSVLIITDADVMSSEFSLMNLDELNENAEYIKYIAKTEDIDQWKNLTDEDAKRLFLFKFWKSKDPDPLSPQNEAKYEYFKRINTANERYGHIQKKGWKTDRGRIYILYAEPSEVERYYYETDTRPYEIWRYNDLEGGVIFVFVDFVGYKDYTLIHSTLQGELRDDNWTRKIYVR